MEQGTKTVMRREIQRRKMRMGRCLKMRRTITLFLVTNSLQIHTFSMKREEISELAVLLQFNHYLLINNASVQQHIVEHLLYFFHMFDIATIKSQTFLLLNSFRGSKKGWLRIGVFSGWRRHQEVFVGVVLVVQHYAYQAKRPKTTSVDKRGHICSVSAWKPSVCIRSSFSSHSQFFSMLTPTTT